MKKIVGYNGGMEYTKHARLQMLSDPFCDWVRRLERDPEKLAAFHHAVKMAGLTPYAGAPRYQNSHWWDGWARNGS